MKKVGRVISVVVIAFVLFWFWIQRFGGRLEQTLSSPDSNFHAEVRLTNYAAATDASTVTITLYPRYRYFGGSVFGAATYGGDVRVKWIDQSHLLVHIEHHDQLEIQWQLKKWKGVTIIYENE